MVHFFHPIYYIMANAVATFPLLSVSEDDTPASFLKTARTLAKEENVSLPKYLLGMLRHALRGHDLSKIHFYQDGSGDTYDVDALQKLIDEAHADDAAGELKTFNSAEEGLAYLAEIRKAVDAGKEVD
jgi:hypothetical protein